MIKPCACINTVNATAGSVIDEQDGAGAGTWKVSENIVHLEARALLNAMQRFALTRFGTKIRQLFLVDNLGVCVLVFPDVERRTLN